MAHFGFSKHIYFSAHKLFANWRSVITADFVPSRAS